MKGAGRHWIKQRRRVLLGCEGDSERSYGNLLSTLLEDRHQDVHLDVVLFRGGDPLKLVERADEHISENSRKGFSSYSSLWLLLDSDRCDEDKDRHKQAVQLSASIDLTLIWQNPCHEAFLLRHIDGCDKIRPKTCAESQTKLTNEWKNYQKGMSTRRLEGLLKREDIMRAAAVEKDLCALLTNIGFI
jgi:hypothetical protein